MFFDFQHFLFFQNFYLLLRNLNPADCEKKWKKYWEWDNLEAECPDY